MTLCLGLYIVLFWATSALQDLPHGATCNSLRWLLDTRTTRWVTSEVLPNLARSVEQCFPLWWWLRGSMSEVLDNCFRKLSTCELRNLNHDFLKIVLCTTRILPQTFLVTRFLKVPFIFSESMHALLRCSASAGGCNTTDQGRPSAIMRLETAEWFWDLIVGYYENQRLLPPKWSQQSTM